jgi:hypothetical protein
MKDNRLARLFDDAMNVLHEYEPPEAIKKVIHAAGISDEMIIKNWNK